MNASVLAGIASTLLFAGSMLPMVFRAWRTRDLASYSRSHLVMTNVGNAIHTVYVISLPGGPIWLLHGFHVVVAFVMLVWHLRFPGAGAADQCAGRVFGEQEPAHSRAARRDQMPPAPTACW
jgi:uncharacterized protein with PQ loop repeat